MGLGSGYPGGLGTGPRARGRGRTVAGYAGPGRPPSCTSSERIERGAARERVPCLSFEDERFAGLDASHLGALVNEYHRRFPGSPGAAEAAVTWCFDEIQVVPGWERFVRRLIDTEQAEVFVTGSSAALLSREIATSLRGRAWQVLIHPFSFEEALRHRGGIRPEGPEPGAEAEAQAEGRAEAAMEEAAAARMTGRDRSRLERALLDWLEAGGFPEVPGLDAATRRWAEVARSRLVSGAILNIGRRGRCTRRAPSCLPGAARRRRAPARGRRTRPRRAASPPPDPRSRGRRFAAPPDAPVRTFVLRWRVSSARLRSLSRLSLPLGGASGDGVYSLDTPISGRRFASAPSTCFQGAGGAKEPLRCRFLPSWIGYPAARSDVLVASGGPCDHRIPGYDRDLCRKWPGSGVDGGRIGADHARNSCGSVIGIRVAPPRLGDLFRACAADAAVRARSRSWRDSGSGGPSPRAADPLAAEARPARSARGTFHITSAPCPRHP